MNKILETTQYVMENADTVSINENAIDIFVNNFKHEHSVHWLTEAPVDLKKFSPEDRLHFIFVFNILSFSY